MNSYFKMTHKQEKHSKSKYQTARGPTFTTESLENETSKTATSSKRSYVMLCRLSLDLDGNKDEFKRHFDLDQKSGIAISSVEPSYEHFA